MRRLLLALTLCGAPASAQTASFQGLGDLPDGFFRSGANGVSADGAVVVGAGNVAAFPGSDLGTEAFRWTADDGMVGLGDLPGNDIPASGANGVSADGAVIVGAGNRANGGEAFRWTADSGMVGLGDFAGGAFLSQANNVSADGAVVVGYGHSANGTEAFRWTADDGMVGLGDLPGGHFESYAYGTSADGAAVVGYGHSASGTEAFRWTADDGMVGLGDLPGGDVFASAAYSISADGSVVVGSSRGTNDGDEAFLWTAEGGMQSVGALLTAAGVNVGGWQLFAVTGISADGTVFVGGGRNPQGQYEAWRAVLPRTPISADPLPAEALVAVHASPNPLRDRATLRFTLPEAGPVRLSVHDVLGREVAVVAEGGRAAGAHEVPLDAAALPAGVYVVRLAAGAQTAAQRITVAR